MASSPSDSNMDANTNVNALSEHHVSDDDVSLGGDDVSIPDDMTLSGTTFHLHHSDDEWSVAGATPPASEDGSLSAESVESVHLSPPSQPTDDEARLAPNAADKSDELSVEKALALEMEATTSHSSNDDEKTIAEKETSMDTSVSSEATTAPDRNVLQEVLTWARAHPVQAAALGISTVALAAPMALAAPVLAGAGFTSSGVAGASLAAAWQSSVGSVAAGSLFAVLQSAGAGGAMGATAVGGAVSAGGWVGVVGIVGGLFGKKRKGKKTGAENAEEEKGRA